MIKFRSFHSFFYRLSFRQIFNIARTLLIIAFILLFGTIFTAHLYAQEKTLVLGGKAGWPELSRMDGVVFGKGRFGYDCVELVTNERSVNSFTDILINFEGNKIQDVTGNYEIRENSSVTVNDGFMGKYSGLMRGTGGIRLAGSKTSIFGKSGITGSFSIEFWLNPSIVDNGEQVFSWSSSRTVANYPLYQMLDASFVNNHLQWNFTNVFDGYFKKGGTITLTSYRTIVPEKWMHHKISYDEETGLLEYRIDGQLESLVYVTTNGRERGGSVYPANLGVVADINICPEFTGFIDDFRIQKRAESEYNTVKYSSYKDDGGRIETQPILISTGASLNRIDAIITEPKETCVVLYVRSGDNFFNWTDTEPAWIPVENHSEIKNVSGLYMQVAADLYPDGGGAHSPSITELKITYTEVPSPLPPYKLFASAGNGEVTLSWNYSVDDSVAGYYVFYGERPGEYLGREAVQGASPVNVGNVCSVTLTGLKNGKIYYFAVAPYSRLDERITGELSKEVYARPLNR